MKKGINILLSLMQLNIGGAETHVVELAKELKRKGFNIIVTSNGGVYVKELEEAGIKHYRVPLQNKNPFNMIKSAKLLKKIIKEEKIDIVHSHARIPSFILGKLYKKMKFPFVTTAHWVFKTGGGLKYITDWGEKTVAVSEDIKHYLMDNYNVPSGDIQVTINGIDTEKFSPDTDTSDILKELNINDSERVIVYVSRMDESRSLVAKQLIEIVPKLNNKIKNLRVVIVGDGDDFNNVKAKTDDINKSIGREVITLTGARTDINKLVSIGELFIGVSRAALEAMAAEKPVIIAGNEGYIGLFDKTKLQVGIDTNFCCRGCAESSSALLYEDIERYLNMSDAERESLGIYGRELIKEQYSVSRMTEDTMKVYEWALAKNKEILISGYYGFNNSGDDALLTAIIQDLKKYKESPNIVVLSANPKETNDCFEVKAISRVNVFKIISHMKKADMLISGGGTLIQDKTSTKSLWYYLAVIAAAKRYGLKVMLYSNGIGPLNKKRNISRTNKILNNVDLITLRDNESYKTLASLGVNKPKIEVTADPALDLESAPKERGIEILKNAGVDTSKKLLGISLRKWEGLGGGFEKKMASICDSLVEKYGYHPVFITMQSSKDLMISNNVISKMKNNASIVTGNYSVNEMMAVVGQMHICLGMRLHLLIYSAVASIPVIGLVYDPKIRSFMDYTNQNHYISINELSSQKIMDMFEECEKNYDNLCAELNGSYVKLRDKAMRNGKLAIELYEKGSVDI